MFVGLAGQHRLTREMRTNSSEASLEGRIESAKGIGGSETAAGVSWASFSLVG